MTFIDGTVVNVALPTLQKVFHASIVDAQWVVESYGLFLSALILVGGALGDRLGRRAVFLTGTVIFAAASVACGLATGIEALIIARSIQGIGAALLVPGSLAIIAAAFDEKSRGKAIGTWSGATAITMALGPVLGGWLIEHGSWRWAFFLNVPLAAAVIVISIWHVPESRAAGERKIDWLGAALATAGLAGIVTGFLESGVRGWHDPLVDGCLILGVICCAAFLMVESRSAAPMVPLAVFRSAAFSGANLITLLLYSAIGVFFFLFPMDLIRVEGYSATAAGAAALPIILLMSFLSRWAGGLVAKYGGRLPLVVGPLIAAAGFLVFVYLPGYVREFVPALPGGGASYWACYFPAFVVLGAGLTITVAPLTTVVMGAVSDDNTGAASGINNAVARVASVLAIAVLGLVMLGAFRASLTAGVVRLGLLEASVATIESRSADLAELAPPAELSLEQRVALERVVDESFGAGLRMVILCCVGLSLASALTAWFVIPRRSKSA
jgi:EmrB/QacA subfamily drug resistance transporter